MSDKTSSIRILDDAKRLNMMDGHFVWLWIDTAAVINVRNATEELADNEMLKRSEFEDFRFKRNWNSGDVSEELPFGAEEIRRKRRETANDINDMKMNYLLRNDQYLLFNSNNFGGDVAKSKKQRRERKQQDAIENSNTRIHEKKLPVGLLSLKPLPVKVDRHLVKGAVRLLVSVLKSMLDRSPSWMVRNLVTAKNNGCWKSNVIKESSFINDFGK